MKFTLEIECDNAAFEPDARREISRILLAAVKSVQTGVTYTPIFDINGNRVGTWEITR